MIKRWLQNGSNFLTQKQTSILSAASVIMIMIAVSRVFGLVRNRVLANFFTAESLSVYLAAFRLPEVVFEVLVFGALSSAFIPTFTTYLSKKETNQAWYVAGVALNFALIFFLLLALLFFVFAQPLYRLITPGFTSEQVSLAAALARILFLCQVFFIFSYFLTGVLESLQRFLIPAIAPLFYNLGIILGTLLLTPRYGIYAPVMGAVVGSFLHFLIQLPLALHLGFRPKLALDWSHPGVKEIGRLALPRMIELSFLQLGKSAELFLASLVSVGAYTYYTFANSLQLLPVGLFGVSLAKAALPTLSYQRAEGKLDSFKKTFISAFNEIVFLTLPLAVFLAVLRIPLVRLVFGAARFTWESTIQTSYALSAFCVGISAQALIYLLNRAFYAFHDTKTPVQVSVGVIFLNILLGVLLILGRQLPIWGLALAYSLGALSQMVLLLILLKKKFLAFDFKTIITPFLKVGFSAAFSGGLMFFLLKVLDRSVWLKQLSFLSWAQIGATTAFNHFFFDTRYVGNVILLTMIVGGIGLASYLLLVRLLRVKELGILVKFLGRFRKPKVLKFHQFDQNDLISG